MLKLLDWRFKSTMINILRSLIAKKKKKKYITYNNKRVI